MARMNKHDWIFLALLAATCMLMFLAMRRCMNAMSIKDNVTPAQEIAAVDNAAEKLKSEIKQAHDLKNKLPEVVKNAKNETRRDIGRLDNSSVADRWNGLLGRYREDRAATEGLLSDE